MGLGKKRNNLDDYSGRNSNMKLIYTLIGLTVVTVILVVLLVLFLNGTFGGEQPNTTATPNSNTSTTPANTSTATPTPTPQTPIDGEVVTITDTITVDQVPVGSAPAFAMGTGDKLGSIIVDNATVYYGDLLLVNSSNPLSEQFKPSKVINIYNESRHNSDYPVSVSTADVEVEQRVLYALINMLKKAEESGNTKYFVHVAYDEAAEDLDLQTGLGFEIGFLRQEGQSGKFAELPQGQWMIQNSYQYGFVQRYTEEKSSVTGMLSNVTQYRYVGFPHSLVMQEKNMCLEEYVAYVRSTKYIQVKNGDALTHEIMYFYADPTSTDGKTVCKLSDTAFTAYSQGNAKITVSGDNFGGFIVTVIYK